MDTASQSMPPTFSFQLVQLCAPAPATLLLVYDKHQHILVCTKQVYNSFLQEHCKYDAFYRHCTSLTKPVVLTGQDPDFTQLVALAGLSNTASSAALITLSNCCKVMHRSSLKVPQELLAAFLQLKDNPTQLTAVASLQSSPTHVQMLRPFPLTLPVCHIPVHKLNQQNGLRTPSKQHLLSTSPLSQQLAACHSYWTTVIRLDRPSHYLRTRTWDNIHQHCCLFLGHCHTHHHKAQPSLELFLQPHLIAHYVSFHLAAGHSSDTIRNFLYSANKVILWWRSMPGVPQDSFNEGLTWLQALHIQVRTVTNPANALMQILHLHQPVL